MSEVLLILMSFVTPLGTSIPKGYADLLKVSPYCIFHHFFFGIRVCVCVCVCVCVNISDACIASVFFAMVGFGIIVVDNSPLKTRTDNVTRQHSTPHLIRKCQVPE